MFDLTDQVINTQKISALISTQAGAVVTFEGRVRDMNFGREVKLLEYEAFEEMAILEGNKIVSEAREKFSILDAHCIHRTGKLELTDLAIWIVVLSKHRRAAYEASEYIIDQVKSRVPIWKKEHYTDGATDWVKCLACLAKGVPHHEHYHHLS